jgi:AcrR family transcriptional regulator
MATQSEKRAYNKKARAEQEEATRVRIAEAAMELHGSVGPARTTISAVAERAGVQRATVYRHFPTEADLFGACSAHWVTLHPPPDFPAWAEIADPDERLRVGLAALYAWYRSDVPMFVNVRRDATLVPAMRGPVEATQAAMGAIADVLMKGRRERGRRRQRILGAIRHAIAFGTWFSLTQEGELSDDEAIEVMTAAVDAAAR